MQQNVSSALRFNAGRSACARSLYGDAHSVLIKCYNLCNIFLDMEDAMTALKITSVGNSAGVLLPKELLAKLRVEKGDILHVIETENGIELTPYDPEFDAQMAVAEDIMREDRDILRKLAK